jgi:hypothetical protein
MNLSSPEAGPNASALKSPLIGSAAQSKRESNVAMYVFVAVVSALGWLYLIVMSARAVTTSF